jgi:outer membrane protein OmpA-like peptidoglycan-associated protein
MNSQKQVITFRKSLLSIVIASVVTSGLIVMEKSQRVDKNGSNTAIVNTLLPNGSLNQISKEISLIAHATRIDSTAIKSEPVNQITEINPSVQSKLDTNVDQVSERLLFAFDSYRIQPVYFDSLIKTAEIMKNTNDAQEKVWQIIGYADPSGDFLYNLSLSEKRAQNVADFLISEGVPMEQLSVVSLGASQSENDLNDMSLIERRVEIHPYHQEITTLAVQLARHKRDIQIARYRQRHTKMLIDDVIAEKQNKSQEQVNQPFSQFTIAMEF